MISEIEFDLVLLCCYILFRKLRFILFRTVLMREFDLEFDLNLKTGLSLNVILFLF
jgi:hypothetical protein